MDILRRSSAQLPDEVWKELDEAAATAAKNVHDRSTHRYVRRAHGGGTTSRRRSAP